MTEVKITRHWAMPNRWTFKIKPIAEYIKNAQLGLSIDPFCGTNELATLPNDLNGKFGFLNHDALHFLELTRNDIADTVFWDGIYSPRQLKECYDVLGLKLTQYQTSAKWWADIKTQIARVTRLGGRVLSFGWNSNGIGISRGFAIEEIMIIAHGGNHNDTIMTVERKIENTKYDSVDPENSNDSIWNMRNDKKFLKELHCCSNCYQRKCKCNILLEVKNA